MWKAGHQSLSLVSHGAISMNVRQAKWRPSLSEENYKNGFLRSCLCCCFVLVSFVACLAFWVRLSRCVVPSSSRSAALSLPSARRVRPGPTSMSSMGSSGCLAFARRRVGAFARPVPNLPYYCPQNDCCPTRGIAHRQMRPQTYKKNDSDM